jgi:dihydroflavonol-4-reductase
VPTRVIPDWAVRIGARFSPPLRAAAPQVGKRKKISGEKARQVLGWQPRTREEAVLATARSLLDLGLPAGPAHDRER